KTPDELTRFEHRALRWKLRDEIFRIKELRDYEWNPLLYGDHLELTHLLERDFAPIEQRLRSVLLRLRAYPRLLAVARQNLRSQLDRTIVETGLMALEGRLEYLEMMPAKYFGEL